MRHIQNHLTAGPVFQAVFRRNGNHSTAIAPTTCSSSSLNRQHRVRKGAASRHKVAHSGWRRSRCSAVPHAGQCDEHAGPAAGNERERNALRRHRCQRHADIEECPDQNCTCQSKSKEARKWIGRKVGGTQSPVTQNNKFRVTRSETSGY